MQLRDYWLIFSKRWWLIALVAVVAVGASVAYSKVQQPVYRSTVMLTVSPSRLDYGLTLTIENLLRQYSEQLQTHEIAATVDSKLQLDLPVDTLLGKVKVSAISTEYVLEMTVDDTDPHRAHDIALVWANQFIQEHQIQMAPVDPTNRIDIQLLDTPTQGVLIFPKTKQYAIAAGVMGVVVGAVLAFLLEYLDDTLKTPEDVERYTGMVVVGQIPDTPGDAIMHPNGRVKGGVTIGGPS